MNHRPKSCGVTTTILLLILIIGQFASLPTAQSWPGFSWDSWKEISNAQRFDLITPQAGRAELVPLLAQEASGELKISTVSGWEAKRAGIFHTLTTLLGNPNQMSVDAPKTQTLGEENVGAYVRRHIQISGETGDPIPAYLLVPQPLPPEPGPAVIVLHQTQAPGKQEAAGMVGNPEMAFAAELIARRYTVLAYDAIGFGERIPSGAQPYDGALEFFRHHPNWSFFGKMVWDFRRAVDYIETLPMVDPRRIAAIGHSHGAYGSIMCSLYDTRIAATVASCGVTTLRTDPNPERWSRLTALIPQLGFYLDDISQAPIDWHEILACLAPRPFFNLSTLDDEIFPGTENLPDVFDQVRNVYRLYGHEADLEYHIIPGKHQFPKEFRELAYQWLDRQLDRHMP